MERYARFYPLGRSIRTEKVRFCVSLCDWRVGGIQSVAGLIVLDGRVEDILPLVEVEEFSVCKSGKVISKVESLGLLRRKVVFGVDGVEV